MDYSARPTAMTRRQPMTLRTLCRSYPRQAWSRQLVVPARFLSPTIHRKRRRCRATARSGAPLTYPEWDYRLGAYHAHAVTVHVVPCAGGAESRVEQTLGRHRSMLQQIRRQFELLRARRSRLRKQIDGDEIDLEAYLESKTDFRAGLPLGAASLPD